MAESDEIKKMSPEAQELINLTKESVENEYGGEGSNNIDLAPILKARPELLVGLDEYLKWRDQTNRQIAVVDKLPSFKHRLYKR